MALYTPIKTHEYYPFVYQYMDNWMRIARSKGYTISGVCRANNLQSSKAYTLRNGRWEAPVNLYLLTRYANAIGCTFEEVKNYHLKSNDLLIDELKSRIIELEAKLQLS